MIRDDTECEETVLDYVHEVGMVIVQANKQTREVKVQEPEVDNFMGEKDVMFTASKKPERKG